MSKTLIDAVGDTIGRRSRFDGDADPVTHIGDEAGDPERVQPVWDRMRALHRSGVHPAVQACIRHHGEVVLHRCIGHSHGIRPGRRVDPGRARPLRLDTPMNLFSAAKAITGMVVHKLEEMGRLGIDDRVADHLPGFERHGKGDITIAQVLSHRSGLPGLPPDAFDLDLLTDQERIESLVCDLEPVRPPGGPPAYHAVVGGFVLDAVCRRVTGGDGLREVLDTEIRRPLGLEWLHFGVDADAADEVAHNVDNGFPLGPLEAYFRRILGIRWSEVLELSNDPRFLTGVIPSGNVISTAHDIAAFYQCLLNGGTLDGVKVFQSTTIERAVAQQGRGVPIDRKLFLPMRYSTAFMLGASEISLYGWNHPRAFGHLGMSNVLTWADPDRHLVVALLTTGKPVLGPHLVAFARMVATIHDTFPVG